MTINQVQLANTFDVWRIATNQLITVANDLKEGNLLSSGTISLSNPGQFNNNVTVNAQSGMIYGDAGLLSNVGKPSSITNQKLQNSSFTITTTQGQIVLSNTTIALGSSVYLNVANLVTVNTDTSVANIASANLVNSVHVIATRADLISNAAYNRSNTVNVGMIAAFALANTTNVKVDSACTAIISLGTVVNLIDANTIAAFGRANIAIANVNFTNTAMQAAFTRANIAIANVNFTNTAMQAAFLTANIAIANVNFTNTATQAAFTRANASVNTVAYSQNTGTSWQGHSVVSTGHRGLNFRDSPNILITVTDDSSIGYANVSITANSLLPNTPSQSGATFVGNLTVSGTTVRDTRGGTAYDLRQSSLSSPAGATFSNPSYVLTGSDSGRLVSFSCATIFLPGGNVANPILPGDIIRIYNANTQYQSANIRIYAAANLVTSGNTIHTVNQTRNVSANSITTIYCLASNVYVAEGNGISV